jgi:hypothetical protein
MRFDALAFAFALAVTIHNLEEALFLPAWSRRAGRWHVAIGSREFRFAVFMLTLLAYLCAGLAAAGFLVGAYLVCGYARAMALNAFVPHLAASVALRSYAPGKASGLLLNLPIGVALLIEAGVERRIAWPTFAWAGPATVIAIVAAIPLLFALGRALGACLRGGGQSC